MIPLKQVLLTRLAQKARKNFPEISGKIRIPKKSFLGRAFGANRPKTTQ
jgi:hypothetical protein